MRLYAVGSSNLAWMSWLDQVHFYLLRLGYRLPPVHPRVGSWRLHPESVQRCDDSDHFVHLETARLGIVGWNSWDFAYDDWDDCNGEGFRSVGGHSIRCGVGPGCRGGRLLVRVSDIAEDASGSDVTLVSTWYNDHKGADSQFHCFGGERVWHAETASVAIPSLLSLVRAIHKKNPNVWVLVMGEYPPTVNYAVADADVHWVRELNARVQRALEAEPRTAFVGFDMPGHGQEVYQRAHYGHPNCRGEKLMAQAVVRTLFVRGVIRRGLRLADPAGNTANTSCALLGRAACHTSAFCWVEPRRGQCTPYSAGSPRPHYRFP